MGIEETNWILAEILTFVRKFNTDNKKWYAGIAYNRNKRKNEYEPLTKVEHFKSWDACTKDNAKNIETQLHMKG